MSELFLKNQELSQYKPTFQVYSKSYSPDLVKKISIERLQKAHHKLLTSGVIDKTIQTYPDWVK